MTSQIPISPFPGGFSPLCLCHRVHDLREISENIWHWEWHIPPGVSSGPSHRPFLPRELQFHPSGGRKVLSASPNSRMLPSVLLARGDIWVCLVALTPVVHGPFLVLHMESVSSAGPAPGCRDVVLRWADRWAPQAWAVAVSVAKHLWRSWCVYGLHF
jgi:hypothetical protein